MTSVSRPFCNPAERKTVNELKQLVWTQSDYNTVHHLQPSYQRRFAQKPASFHQTSNSHVEIRVTTTPVGNFSERISGKDILRDTIRLLNNTLPNNKQLTLPMLYSSITNSYNC